MTARKGAGKAVRGRPFTGRDDPRNGKTPPPISPGRTPDEFKAKMRELASRDDVLAQLTEILQDKAHPHYIRAWQEAADRGYGKAQQSIDVTSGGKDIAELLRKGRDRVARMRDQ